MDEEPENEKEIEEEEQYVLETSEMHQLQERAIKPPVKRPLTLALVDKDSSTPLKSSVQRIGENMLAATNECDLLSQLVITLLQNYDQKKFNKPPKTWQQRFKNLRLDKNNFIYNDERLVIPEELRRPISRSLHWNTRKGKQCCKLSRISGGRESTVKLCYWPDHAAVVKKQVKI